MSKSSKMGKMIGVATVAVSLGIGFGWYLSQRGDVVPVAVPPPPPSLLTNGQAVKGGPAQPTNSDSASDTAATDASDKDPGATAPPAEEPKTWDQKLDDILLSADDPSMKATKILALMPLSPPAAQVELSQHLVNMVQDDNYAGTAALLTNSATSSDVSTVLMNDLLNRNNTLKLPMLLSIARNDDHPLKGQAKEMLELFIQQDKGTNWDDWSTAIDTWIANNPQ